MTLPRIHKSVLGVTDYTTRQYMQPGEQDILLALVATVQPRTMIEIGVNEGLTAQAVLRHVKSIHQYIGIDVAGDYQFEIPAQASERPRQPGVLVERDPRFKLWLRNDWLDKLPSSADVIFIDGDHGRSAVMMDSLWAAEAINNGGMIIWHDYGNPTVEVTAVLDDLQASGRNICHVAHSWLAFERR